MAQDVTGATDPEVALLGPLELRGAGRTHRINSPAQRALLGLLALRRGRLVRPEEMSAALWGDAAPRAAVASLRSHLTRLRTILAAAGADAGALLWRDAGYTLDPTRIGCDVERFERLRLGAREQRCGDPARAADMLRAALALWRGPALAEFAERDFARAAAVGLEDARRAAVEELVEVELDSDAASLALARIDAHLADNPLREQAWALRMRALYRLGRQAEALDAYRALRAMLGHELGIEPTPALRNLELQILRQDPELDPRPRGARGRRRAGRRPEAVRLRRAGR